ncbi:heme ABC transporter ATP-binding protein [Roseospira marina]|uniref:Heme ABC transporter ATP-binding protein n=1 Tax=Roseospira marina TaxID=140057 RepID=A0A5M6IDR8_9PROT|nr:heme ABC transporter ATP-binding protein [Roseospira marina]KAA5606431.1 heme ABC transporter ATP-binding protein [Roseospira marina]MBB4314155.1 iron complex transport system ATP-binding protein [Roseospira marina]MBB5087316.1 iron complex transport system ATP-binding protein [Roseospira marina]
MLEGRDLTVIRRGRRIVDDVTLDVPAATVTALIGPNGAGKSTLLHLLSGALAPQAGTVTFAGRPLAQWSRAALARHRAVLPQASELSFPFRALDVVRMGRAVHAGRSGRDHDAAVAVAALEAVDGLALADRVYPTLSGGERQRVQLARVLAQIWTDPARPEPEGAGRALLLDEPTNNLDLTHQHQLMRFARRLADEGVAVLAVLHDPNLAALYADRMVVLADGCVAAEGPVEAVMTETVLTRTFGLPVTIQRHPGRGTPQLVPS